MIAMGVECELAVVQDEKRLTRPERIEACRELTHALGPSLSFLHGSKGGRVYENGGGACKCTGDVLEIQTPECSDPYRAAGHVAAARQRLGVLADRRGLALLAHNCDHWSLAQGRSWITRGMHTSFSVEDVERLARGLVPFLVASTVFSGTGLVDPRRGFTLSQRARYLTRVRSSITDGAGPGRAIYSTRERLHDRGPQQRLHLVLFDQPRSQAQLALVLGACALTIAALQEEPRPAFLEEVSPKDPLGAYHRVGLGGDPAAAYPNRRGRRVPPSEVLWRYHDWTGGAAARMAPWAQTVRAEWSRILTELEGPDPWGSEFLCRRYDAYLKRALLERAVPRGRRLEDVTTDRALFHQLARLEASFHRLGSRSLFERLEAEGALDHRVVPDADLARWLVEPPPDTRARHRGRFVRERLGRDAEASWSCLADWENGVLVRLPDVEGREVCREERGGPWPRGPERLDVA